MFSTWPPSGLQDLLSLLFQLLFSTELQEMELQKAVRAKHPPALQLSE